jgi:hypothetical protein
VGERLVVNDDSGGGVARRLPGLRGHRDHRLPDEAHRATGGQAPVHLGVRRGRLQFHEPVGQRLHLVGKQAAQVARHPLGRFGVDPHDAGVRVGRAHEDQVAEMGDRCVVAELALRLQQPVVLLAQDRLPGPGGAGLLRLRGHRATSGSTSAGSAPCGFGTSCPAVARMARTMFS